MKNGFKRVVLTGAPGCGKSTLLDALSQQGFATLPESALAVIESEDKKPNPTFPWNNPVEFQHKSFSLQWEWESKPLDSTVLIQDRSLIDILGFCAHYHVPIQSEWLAVVNQFHYDCVFFLEPLPSEIAAITRNGHPRMTTIEQREKIGQAILNEYENRRYSITRVPFKSVEERARFVMEKMF